MITTILGLLAGIGVPAIITGILGKVAGGFLGKILGTGAISALLTPILKLCIGLVDCLLIVLRWLLSDILIPGINHIVGSVKATIVVLLLCWGSYWYAGTNLSFSLSQPKVVKEASVPLPVRKDAAGPTNWIKRNFGW